jgi:hypothetical protein
MAGSMPGVRTVLFVLLCCCAATVNKHDQLPQRGPLGPNYGCALFMEVRRRYCNSAEDATGDGRGREDWLGREDGRMGGREEGTFCRQPLPTAIATTSKAHSQASRQGARTPRHTHPYVRTVTCTYDSYRTLDHLKEAGRSATGATKYTAS